MKKSSKKTQGISIITSAYKAMPFLKDYLDSIESQTYFKDFNDYEILLGIDSCEETLKKAQEIGKDYRNLRLFWFPKHAGTYVIRNTLVGKAKYDYLIFFDADDIMKDNFVSQTIEYRNDRDMVRYNFENFTWGMDGEPECSFPKFLSHGVHSLWKRVFDEFGGYLPWGDSADTEFINRMHRFGYEDIAIPEELFLRRRHKNSLMAIFPDLEERKTRVKNAENLLKYVERVTSKCKRCQTKIKL